jgi:putative DNA primase/helicase
MSSAEFIAFARAHGVEIDASRLDDSGKLRRCATTEHPRSKNGAYCWDGEGGFVWAWDSDARAIPFRQYTQRQDVDRSQAIARRRNQQAERRVLAAQAAQKAQEMLAQARPEVHGYLHRKGFPAAKGLVMPDGSLVIPMREVLSNRLLGAQVIRWLPEETRWEKKYLWGMTSKGAVLCLGDRHAPERVFCEGYATGLTLEAAIRQAHMRVCVVVTFSAHNLTHVASLMGGRRYVIADHDAPQRDPDKAALNPGEAGQRAAIATGLPWAMPDEEGDDANDLMVKRGLLAVVQLVMKARAA